MVLFCRLSIIENGKELAECFLMHAFDDLPSQWLPIFLCCCFNSSCLLPSIAHAWGVLLHIDVS